MFYDSLTVSFAKTQLWSIEKKKIFFFFSSNRGYGNIAANSNQAHNVLAALWNVARYSTLWENEVVFGDQYMQPL